VTSTTTTRTTTSTITAAAAAAAAPRSILKKRPMSCTTTTTSRQSCLPPGGAQRVQQSAMGHSPTEVGGQSGAGLNRAFVHSRSMSSGSLRDSLELTKSHLQPSGKTSDPSTNGEVRIADLHTACQLFVNYRVTHNLAIWDFFRDWQK